jgi:hypothetical protein
MAGKPLVVEFSKDDVLEWIDWESTNQEISRFEQRPSLPINRLWDLNS